MKIGVVLLRHVRNLGHMGTVCAVKRGYAAYLLRKEWALRATKENLVYFESERENLEASNQVLLDAARVKEKKLEKAYLHFIRAAGNTGQLYGSVHVRDIVQALSGLDVQGVTPGMIILTKAIKNTGVHFCQVQLHPEISIALALVVGRNQEEVDRLEAEDKNPTPSQTLSPELMASTPFDQESNSEDVAVLDDVPAPEEFAEKESSVGEAELKN